jgi:DNA-binding LacI/PurR family transcriptional regulator
MGSKRFNYIDKIQFDQDSNKSSQLYQKLSLLLRKEGKNFAGYSIISERQASLALNVNRTAIHKAYEKLLADGILERTNNSRNYKIAPFDEIHPGQCIGLILPYLFSEYMNNPAYLPIRLQLYLGIADRAAELSLGILPINLPNVNCSKVEFEAFKREKLPTLAGLIHLGNRSIENDTILDELWRNPSVPQVSLLSINNYAHCGSVSFDHISALQACARHFRDFGHKKLAIFSPKFNNIPGLRYVLQSVEEAAEIFNGSGMIVNKEWTYSINQSDSCYLSEALDNLLSLPNHPRAIWCRNDRMAIEILKLLQNRNKKVPEEYSVISMDNLAESALTNPPLTTLQLPFYNCGREAVNMLLDIRKTGVSQHLRVKRLPASLIVRNSVGINKISHNNVEPF